MKVQGQQPDWQKLYLQGSCKFVNVPWTDDEIKLISKSGERDPAVVKKLREEYLNANQDDFTDPKRTATTKVVEAVIPPLETDKKEELEQEADLEEQTELPEESPLTPLGEKVVEYTRLYGKEPTGRRANDEIRLDKKIAEKQ